MKIYVKANESTSVDWYEVEIAYRGDTGRIWSAIEAFKAKSFEDAAKKAKVYFNEELDLDGELFELSVDRLEELDPDEISNYRGRRGTRMDFMAVVDSKLFLKDDIKYL